MNFLLIGGDERSLYIFEMLREAGHGVFPLGLDKVLPLQGPPDYGGTEAALLPLPAERGGFLNAPLGGAKLTAAEALAPLPPGTRVFAGMAGEGLRECCRERGLILRDYFGSEELQQALAAITARAAAEMLGDAAGRRILIGGFGRIGSRLCALLKAEGAELTVAARSPEQRAAAEAMGCAAADFRSPGGDYAAVVNTVPAPVFGREAIAAFGPARLLELASAPYGFDLAAAEALGRQVEIASGLPARRDPRAAAEAVLNTVFKLLEE